MLRQTRNILWRVGALAAFAIGVVRWLLEHRFYGPHIRSWRERGVVPRTAKIWAVLTMFGSAVLLQLLDVPGWLRLGAPLMMAAVAVWLWRRPEN